MRRVVKIATSEIATLDDASLNKRLRGKKEPVEVTYNPDTDTMDYSWDDGLPEPKDGA